jgi:hypothetical protein
MSEGQSLGTATGSIRIDTADLLRIQALAQQVGAQVAQSLGQIDGGAKRAETGLKDLAKAGGQTTQVFAQLKQLIGIGGGIFGAIQAARMVAGLVEASAQAQRLRENFDEITASAGHSGEAMLAAMRSASNGMISDNSLVLSANKAMLLGVAKNAEDMTKLLEVARARGQAMGLSTAQAFNDLVTGLGRMSPLILDNLGIEIKGKEKFFDVFAASVGRTADSLSDAEKKAALLAEVLRTTGGMIESAGSRAETTADKIERLGAQFDNLKKSFGDLIIASGANDFFDALNDSIKQSDQQIEALIKHYKELKQLVAANVPGANLVIQDPEVTARGNIGGDQRVLAGLNEARARLLEDIANGTRTGAAAQADLARLDSMIAQVNGELGQFGAALLLATGAANNVPAGGFHRNLGGSPEPVTPGFTTDQTKAIVGWAQSVQKIEADASAARLAATTQFEAQRTAAVASYEEARSREAQDFGISRARQAEDLARNIAGIETQSAKNAARWFEDLNKGIAKAQADSNKRIAELTADSNKRLAEIEADYQKSREQAERDHKDNLLDAAANLDAKAVFQEQKRFAKQSADAKDAHDDAISKERAGLAERTQAEQEHLAERIQADRDAYAQRLQDAKDADAERIAEARRSMAEQQTREDEDRAIRLSRQADDFAAQQTQAAAAQAAKMQDIANAEAAEKTALNDKFTAELEALNLHNGNWLLAQKQGQALALKAFQDWWADVAKIPAAGPVQGPPAPGQAPVFFRGFDAALGNFIGDLNRLKGQIPAFANGGAVKQTGLATVHAGEYVLSNDMLARIGGVAGVSQAMRGGHTLALASGAIQIYAAPGMDEEALGDIVERRLVRVLEEIAQ